MQCTQPYKFWGVGYKYMNVWGTKYKYNYLVPRNAVGDLRLMRYSSVHEEEKLLGYGITRPPDAQVVTGFELVTRT